MHRRTHQNQHIVAFTSTKTQQLSNIPNTSDHPDPVIPDILEQYKGVQQNLLNCSRAHNARALIREVFSIRIRYDATSTQNQGVHKWVAYPTIAIITSHTMIIHLNTYYHYKRHRIRCTAPLSWNASSPLLLFPSLPPPTSSEVIPPQTKCVCCPNPT